MKPDPIRTAPENIYISPLELCNLSCLYCYTNKTKSILTNEEILKFIAEYQQALAEASLKNVFFADVEPGRPDSQEAKKIFERLPKPEPALRLKSIIFCGGEVFTGKFFPDLVNTLQSQGIFISIITNGTIDKLDQIRQPHNCQLIVSFDGPESIHDANRGAGSFARSLSFVHHALDRGFPVEIFFLVTRDSYPYKDTFPQTLRKLAFSNLHFTYLVDRLGSLNKKQITDIRQNYDCYPPAGFGCSVISLQSDKKIYGCCETSHALGSLSDPLEIIIQKFIKKLSANPFCIDPAFACGFQNEMKKMLKSKAN